ncbi:hypothetical protein L1987_63016 [Smallanthus sonchifolius]|uniref:Uncharacterized protein n=1 Tax=Smallanthus sonchifolius TaxID=185202 RepID=A0ACB9CC46_9ASTR|nr:hypothetical protein L1987_63016 [Smallanthus sonchifolius]
MGLRLRLEWNCSVDRSRFASAKLLSSRSLWFLGPASHLLALIVHIQRRGKLNKQAIQASLLLLLELHKKDGSGEKSYPQAFAYRMVEGRKGSNTFRLMLDHCIRDISNELSDL